MIWPAVTALLLVKWGTTKQRAFVRQNVTVHGKLTWSVVLMIRVTLTSVLWRLGLVRQGRRSLSKERAIVVSGHVTILCFHDLHLDWGLTVWQDDWLTYWLADWLNNWQTDWLTNLLVDGLNWNIHANLLKETKKGEGKLQSSRKHGSFNSGYSVRLPFGFEFIEHELMPNE